VIALELPGARVAFSTRVGGVSEGPYESLNLGILTEDEPARVIENRRRLAECVGLRPEAIAMGWQVHGAGVREWRGPPRPPDGPPGEPLAGDRRGEAGFAEPGAPLPRVDGHVTSAAGVGLLVLVADCLPLALASGDRVAMVHCGWRGLAAGIVERALEQFAEPPAAAVGPGIGPCCYEVGREVQERFADLEGVAPGRMLDLRAIVRQRLRSAGVVSIEDVDLCTSCQADLFFSHRRDGGVTGRQAGLVWRPAEASADA
jgi:YfiH family protein